jgi:putative transposase
MFVPNITLHYKRIIPGKQKFCGMNVFEAQKIMNRKLKRLLADYALDNVALKDLLSKKW